MATTVSVTMVRTVARRTRRRRAWAGRSSKLVVAMVIALLEGFHVVLVACPLWSGSVLEDTGEDQHDQGDSYSGQGKRARWNSTVRLLG